MFWKNFAIFTEKHLCKILFLSYNLRRDSGKGFSSEFCKIFKKNFLKEHLWMSASILQQLLTLYFAIIYNWQLLSSEKLLVGKKFIPIFQGFCRFRFPLHRFVFHFLWQMPAYLVSYANGMLHSEQPTVLLARRHLNTMLLTNFEKNTRFLSFDGATNYLHLFKNHRQTILWPAERPSSHLKVIKIWFGPNIKYLKYPSLRIFAAGKASVPFNLRWIALFSKY